MNCSKSDQFYRQILAAGFLLNQDIGMNYTSNQIQEDYPEVSYRLTLCAYRQSHHLMDGEQ